MEAYERRHRRPQKSWDRRRPSLHRGFHSENESAEENTPEATSEEEPRARHKPKCSCLDCQASRLPHKRSAGHPQAGHFDYPDPGWYGGESYGDRHAWPNRQFPYPESRHHPESEDDDSLDEYTDTDESAPHLPSEAKMYSRRSARGHVYPTDPYSDDDDDEDDVHDEPENWPRRPRRPGEPKMYHTSRSRSRPARSRKLPVPLPPGSDEDVPRKASKRAMQGRSRDQSVHGKKVVKRKSSRHLGRVPGAFSDEEAYGTKKLSLRPYQSDEHNAPGSKTSKSEQSGDHAPHHIRAPSPPQAIRRRAGRKNSEKSAEGPFAPPKLRNPSTAEKENPLRQKYGGDASVRSPGSHTVPRAGEDHLAELRGARRDRPYARPGVTGRSMSDNLLTRSNIGYLNEARSGGVRPRAGQKHSEATASLSSSVSGVLGPKTFMYNPLEGRMDFRLVRVLPERTAKLKCEIMHASLDTPPEYIAISYAWGDGFDTKRLVLGGATISVAATLHGALKAVRDKEDEVLVWVDGLSIDQQNKTERAAQVLMMSHIFSKAKFVAIWLGAHADDSQVAIPLLEEVAKGKMSKKRIRAITNPDSAALQTLFKRGYWSRLWVVQEVFLAQEIWVYCGSSQLPWDAYEAASDAFWEHESDPHLCEGPSSFPNIDSLVGLGPNSLLELLRACRKKLSEDPRDKIFGILGMVPEDIRKYIAVNYEQPVKSLYIDVADQIISSTRRLDVIRESIHFPLHSSSADLPSWCPEWSQMPELSALRERTFAAAGDTEAEFEFHDNERKLEFSAVELGTVDAMGVAVGTLCALQDYLMAFLHWRSLLLDVTNIDEQGENTALLEAFCRTLSLGQVPQEWERRGWMGPCYHAFSSLILKRLPRLPIDTVLQQHANTALMHSNELRAFVQKHFGDRMMGRTFCITKNGLMGMGSGFMGKGDIVVVPFGCSTPIILRAEGPRGEYRYVGDVYIHGFMHGEALTGNKPVKKYMVH